MGMRNRPGKPAQLGPGLGASWEIFPHAAYHWNILSHLLSAKTVAREGALSPSAEQAFLAHTELSHASRCGGRILWSDERQGHSGIICMWLLSMFLGQCTKNSAFKSVEFSPQRNPDRNTPKNCRIAEVHATFSTNKGSPEGSAQRRGCSSGLLRAVGRRKSATNSSRERKLQQEAGAIASRQERVQERPAGGREQGQGLAARSEKSP